MLKFLAASMKVPPAQQRSPRFRFVLLATLLVCMSGLASAEETMASVLTDFDQHGYTSPRLAIQRLQSVTDRPAATAPVEEQLRYQSRMALLAMHGKHRKEIDAAVLELKRLTEGGRCVPCGAHLLAMRVGQAEVNNDRAAIKVLLDQLTALPPATDLAFEAERLGMLSRGRALLEEEELALGLAVQAIDMAGRAELPAAEVRMMNLLVRVHFSRGDMASALRVMDDGYKLAERIGFRYLMAQFRINQNYAYGTLKQEDKAHKALLAVLPLTNGEPGTEALEQIAQTNLSAYYIHRGEYAKAIRSTLAAEKLARKTGDDIGVAYSVSNRGSALARSGRVDEGMALMEEAMVLAEKAGGRRVVLDLLAEQVNVLERAGRDRDALVALRRMFTLSGDVTTAEREKAVLELQEKFSGERKNREIERLSLSNARSQAEVAARAWQQRLWAAVAVAMLLSSVLLVLWVRMVRRRNQALAVDNAELTSQSIHDPLTGAFNRRHFERLMTQQEATLQGRSRDRKYQASVGLILLDVDHFKKVNDTFGHAAGDEVLKVVAERLRSLVRDQDVVVRWGGEEFVLVLPGTPPEGLPVVAAKALLALGREPVMHEGVEIPVRASAGAIAWPAWPNHNWSDALHLADLALYQSKTNGRNRATCIMSVREGADLGRVHTDLAGAGEAGDVVLQVISGPT